MAPAALLRYALLPVAHFTVLVFLVVASLLAAVALNAFVLLSLPAIALLCSWLYNYAFVLLESIANGAQEPPVLALEMLNPVNEWRAAFQFGMSLMVAVLLSVLAVYVDPRPAAVLAVLYLIFLPASTGALAVGSSLWQSLNPVVLWHIARVLGLSYLILVTTILLYGFIDAWLIGHTSGWWAVTAWSGFAWLSIFSLIGGSLYEHRIELGHDALDSPERREERLQYETDRQHQRFLDGVHGQARNGNLAGAWATIETELTRHQHAFSTYDWLLDALSEREDARLATRLAQEYVARALGRDNARATLIAQRGLAIDDNFRPRSGAQCLRVAELLRLAGDRPSAQRLLTDFATRYPGDAAIPDAEALYAVLARR